MTDRRESESQVDVSVIIVNYNTPHLTHKAIQSVWDHSPSLSKEVIVVDNASSDTSVLQLQEKWGNKILLIRNGENVGFARANNQAMQRARGEYFFLLNSDAELIGNALEGVLKFATQYNDVGIVGCKVVSENGQQQESCWRTYTVPYFLWRALYLYKILPDGFLGATNVQKYGKPQSSGPVEVVSGCAMLVRRTAYETAGGFDNRYFMYCEDTEWCTRMRANHCQVLYYSDASVLHYGQGTSAKMAGRMSKAQSHSVLLFMQDRYGYLRASIVNLFMLIYFLVRVPLWAVMVVFGAQKKKAAQTVQIYCQMMVWHLLWFCRRTKGIV